MKIIPPIVGVPSFFKCLSLINLLTDCPKCNFLNNGTTNKPVIKDKINPSIIAIDALANINIIPPRNFIIHHFFLLFLF